MTKLNFDNALELVNATTNDVFKAQFHGKLVNDAYPFVISVEDRDGMGVYQANETGDVRSALGELFVRNKIETETICQGAVWAYQPSVNLAPFFYKIIIENGDGTFSAIGIADNRTFDTIRMLDHRDPTELEPLLRVSGYKFSHVISIRPSQLVEQCSNDN